MKKSFNITTKIFQECIFENLFPLKDNSTRIILRTGKVIYSSEETAEYNFFDFYNDHCRGFYFDSLKEPYMVYTGVGSSEVLENLKYSNDTIDYLNREGLKIFLQEIIFCDFGERKTLVAKPEWIKHSNQVTYSDIKFNFLYDNTKDDIYCFEFESIKAFVEKNKLTNVSVYTCENNTRDVFQKIYPEFKIFSANSWTTSYNSNHINDRLTFSTDYNLIEKKFMSLSLRYEINKHIVSLYLLEKNSEMSWHENSREWDIVTAAPLEYLNSELPFDITQWKISNPSRYQLLKNNSETLKQKCPLMLNCEKQKLEKQNRMRCGTEVSSPVDVHQKTFCYVVCETKYGQPFGYFSEKVLDSMTFLRPFILVSTPNSLKYLKMHGFKTFDRWWDESYDQEEDHEKRILKIFDVIDYIDSLSIDQLKQIIQEMNNVLIHNKNQILEIRKNLMVF
jgi:hypothetical protein